MLRGNFKMSAHMVLAEHGDQVLPVRSEKEVIAYSRPDENLFYPGQFPHSFQEREIPGLSPVEIGTGDRPEAFFVRAAAL